jgi:hypothetical protein
MAVFHKHDLTMHEDFAAKPEPRGEIQILGRRIKQLSRALAILAAFLVLCIALLGFFAWHQSRALGSTRQDILFGRFEHYDYDSDDYVAPVVNAIQFFHDGYSLQFEKVEYTPAGLLLSGEIGNPNQFRILSLNLTFAVRPYPDKIRKKWAQAGGRLVGWSPDWDLGRAQTSVGDLGPGQTARFRLIVPNIKQDLDPIRIAVLFSGEHYIYPAPSRH